MTNLRKILLLIIASCAMNLSAIAQNLNISIKNKSVKEAVEIIRQKSGYRFVYNSADFITTSNVTFDVKNGTIKDVVAKLITNQNVDFEIDKKNIIIKKKAPAQITKVTGKVIDTKSKQPVIGATVVQQGTTNATTTGVNGEYSISAPTNAILEVQYMGYKTEIQNIANRSIVHFELTEGTLAIDEVVVIGYGEMKKRDLTGSVSAVSFDDSPVNTFSSISQALSGKAAGMQVATISAQPGGLTDFNIRGAASTGAGNAPLIVIDGFPISGTGEPGSGNRYNGGPKDNVLASLNPNDIESIVVLKDASSTAIYGARAGHGVILVTTKQGKAGKVKIEYSGNFSFQNVANRVETLNSSEWMSEYNRYARESYLYDNKMGVYSLGGNSKEVDWSGYKGDKYSAAEIANPEYDTDWMDDVLRRGAQQQHSLSMSGGSENTRYLTSINYFDQSGVIKNSNMNRFNARFNLDQNISKMFKAGIKLTANQNTFDNVAIGSGDNQDAGILISAVNSNPNRPIKDEKGVYTTNPSASYIPNSSSLLEIDDVSKMSRFLGNAYAEVAPIKELRVKALLGVDRNINKRKTYMPKTTLYGAKSNGEAAINQTESSDYLFELTATYSKLINKHNINAMAGYSFQDFNWEGVGSGNQDFLIDGWGANNLGAGAYPKPAVSSWAGKSQMASFFGRVNYTFDDRYLLTATLRSDGASNLAKGNQWGYFPSVAVGWNIHNEQFFAPMKDIFSQAKLRVSYGETGNSNIGNKALDYYGINGEYIFGGIEYKGVALGQLGNSDLTWETTSEVNIGLDLEIANRVNVTAEYYNRTISNLLSTRYLMSYHEMSSIAANIGATQSKGFELTVNSTNIERPNFSWSTDLTFSFYRDRWKERDPSWKPASYESTNDFIRSSFGYLSDGLISPSESGLVPHMPGAVAGQVKIKDIDGFKRDSDGNVLYDDNGKALKTGTADGVLDEADRVYLGNWDPGYIFGMNNSLKYKNWDFNLYMYGQADKLMAGSWKTSVEAERIFTDYGMVSTYKEYWSSGNQNNKYASLLQRSNSYGVGDYYFDKIWYLRVRNITLGYTFPVENSKVLQSARVFVDVNNPILFTNYEGLDPETDSYSGGVTAYPNVRSYTFGVSLTF